MGVGANSWNLIWVLVIYNFYKSCIHSHIICICTCVPAAAEEVIYEVVAEPPEPLEQPQKEERRENQAQGPVDPGVEQQTQGKLRRTFYYLKL